MPAVFDATDATFESAVLDRSTAVPVVIDLWAPWCGPCKTLGPVLERAVEATNGAVVLAKVNIDENPEVQAAFRVQSIPAVFALRDRTVVDHFIGALPEAQVVQWVASLLPEPSEVDRLVAKGDEESLRGALELEPGNPQAVVALAELLVDRGEGDEALSLLARIPETAESRKVAALARMGTSGGPAPLDDVDQKLSALLDRVKDDEVARQEYLDLLEVLGADDARTAQYRKALTSRLF